MYLLFSLLLLFVIWKIHYAAGIYHARLSLSALPQPPVDSFFKGNEPTLTEYKSKNAFLDLFVKWTEEHGKNILFWIGVVPFIFVSDPEMLRSVATDINSFNKVKNLPNRSLFGQKIIGTESILSGGGIRWAVKRKIMSQFFAKTNMKELFNGCKAHMEGPILEKWRENIKMGTEIDLHDELAVTFASFLQVFGLQDFYSPEVVAENVSKILEAIPKPLFNRTRYFMSQDKVDMTKLIQHMRKDLTVIVMQRSEEFKGMGEQKSDDLIGLLIEANMSIDGKTQIKHVVTVESVVDDLMTICLVMDNMVKQLCALFMFLDKEPEVQSKMMEELRSTEINNFRDLAKLEYTEKCLLEGLRMGPALLRGTRNYLTNQNGQVGPYKIRAKHIRIHFSEYVMHMDPTNWPEPKKFNPDRWSDGFNPSSFSYLPFWTGSRGCLGKHLAMMLMKLSLSVLCRNFEMRQAFDLKNPPMINQNMAVMRLINKVNVDVRPLCS